MVRLFDAIGEFSFLPLPWSRTRKAELGQDLGHPDSSGHADTMLWPRYFLFSGKVTQCASSLRSVMKVTHNASTGTRVRPQRSSLLLDFGVGTRSSARNNRGVYSGARFSGALTSPSCASWITS